VPNRREAYLRHSSYYSIILRTARDLFLHSGSLIKEGLDLISNDWANIQTGHVWTDTHKLIDLEAARICSSYSISGTYLLDLRLAPKDRVSWLESALAAAKYLNDQVAIGIHLGNLGLVCVDLAEYQKAIEYYPDSTPPNQ